MRYMFYFCIILFIISFGNNFINYFDYLKDINEQTEVEVFYQMIDDNVVTKTKHGRFKLLYKYILYFIFFNNIEDALSLIKR